MAAPLALNRGGRNLCAVAEACGAALEKASPGEEAQGFLDVRDKVEENNCLSSAGMNHSTVIPPSAVNVGECWGDPAHRGNGGREVEEALFTRCPVEAHECGLDLRVLPCPDITEIGVSGLFRTGVIVREPARCIQQRSVARRLIMGDCGLDEVTGAVEVVPYLLIKRLGGEEPGSQISILFLQPRKEARVTVHGFGHFVQRRIVGDRIPPLFPVPIPAKQFRFP